jgi:uncharacterized membrane protein YvbJ
MEAKYDGMTVNERLYLSGLMDEFDKAVEAKNVDAVRTILQKVDLNDESIKPILEYLQLHQ